MEVLLTRTAVVRTLRTRETALRPAVRSTIHGEEGVLLLNTKPRLDILRLIHDLLSVMTEVSAVGGAIVVVALCEDEDVITAAERILEYGSGAEVDVGVGTRCLVGGRTVEVPDTEIVDAGDLLGHGLV